MHGWPCPCSACYLGLDIDVATRMPNTNFWCHPDTDIEASYQACYAGRLPEQLPFFVASASLKDPGNPRTAPPGHSAVELMAVVPPDATWWGVARGRQGLAYRSAADYRARKQAITDALIDRATSLIPDLRAHVVLQRGVDPAHAGAVHRIHAGDQLWLELSRDQVGFRRPDLALKSRACSWLALARSGATG